MRDAASTGRSGFKTGQERRFASRLNGLRGRMTLLLLAVLLLPTGFAIYSAVMRYQQEGEQAELALTRTARLIAHHLASSLENVHTWLEQSAHLDSFPEAGPACDQALAAKRAEMRLIKRLTLFDRYGQVICDADGGRNSAAVRESFWFGRAVRGAVGTVSELLPDVDGTATLVAAVPLYTGDSWRSSPWAPQGVLAAALHLDAFAASEQLVDLPPERDNFLVDRLGQRLPTLGPVEEADTAAAYETLVAGERQNLDRPADEAAMVVRAPVGFTGLEVVAVAPNAAGSWRSREALLPILLPAVILATAVVAIFGGTHLFVNRHVERLAEAVRRHRPGDGGLARATAAAPNELGELGSRFARLTEELEEREASLQQAILQKELLLNEVNHRVKNNLQIVASLLRMRARSGQTPESRAAIRDAHARIEAIALVHRRLYEEGAVEAVELGAFLEELLAHLSSSLGSDLVRIELENQLGKGWLTVERTVSLALLVTELVSNATEHAFVGRPGGRIRVSLTPAADGGVRLGIADDGIGFDPSMASGGTGIDLAELLARRLNGTLRLAGGAGGSQAVLLLPPGTLDGFEPAAAA